MPGEGFSLDELGSPLSRKKLVSISWTTSPVPEPVADAAVMALTR